MAKQDFVGFRAEDGQIHAKGYGVNGDEHIGWDLQAFDSVKDKAFKYLEELFDISDILRFHPDTIKSLNDAGINLRYRPQSSEQIMVQQQHQQNQMNAEMLEAIKNLNSQLQEMKNKINSMDSKEV